jgi:hypothetical protein
MPRTAPHVGKAVMVGQLVAASTSSIRVRYAQRVTANAFVAD